MTIKHPLTVHQLINSPMVNKANSVLRVFQNNNDPIELVVRESIQNSLDAKSPNRSPVQIQFNVSSIQNSAFNHLDGNLITHFKLRSNQESKSLEIRDNGTGLEGDLIDNQDKNLQRLVYKIGQSHQNQNQQGGSWGYGKTVYYRLGKGFVIFYSRIRKAY